MKVVPRKYALCRQLSVKGFFICEEGIRQDGMLAFQFGAAREREKLAKRGSHRWKKTIEKFLRTSITERREQL